MLLERGADVNAHAGRYSLTPLINAAASEQASARQLLDADSQAHVALTRLDRHDRRAQCGRARGARVGDVVDGDACLADLLLQLLGQIVRELREFLRHVVRVES